MKKRLIWPLMVLVALMVLTVSCKKSRYCHCIGETYQKVQSTGDTIDFADTVVINVDRSMRCDHILYGYGGDDSARASGRRLRR